MIDVELTKGQYEALMFRTQPNDFQTERIRDLRGALESARKLKSNHRYAVEFTAEMVDAASYVLKVAALKGGDMLLASNLFDRRYVTADKPRREVLLSALEGGKEVRETRTNKPVTYEPEGDAERPWTVYEPDLRQTFRLADAEVTVRPQGV